MDNSHFKILVVDDVPTNVLLLKAVLKKEGYVIVTANNGAEALEVAEKELPDVVLLDVMMPIMDGYESAKRFRMHETLSEIPIIFLTALNSTEDIVTGFNNGGSDYVSKPFNNSELLVRVKHQVALIEAHRIIERQNEELKKTIQNRDKLYSVIAHDLRSPMGTMKMLLNFLSMTLSKEGIGSEPYDMLVTANQTTEELFQLLDNLLKWTKSQTGRTRVVFQSIDLNELAKGVVDVYAGMALAKHITLRLETKCHAHVWADTDMVKTVLRNLLGNAIKFSYEQKEIIVSICQLDKMVEISVIDFGSGISEENQKKIRVSGETVTTYGTKNEEGSGLGLVLCKDFVERNNGEFYFQSKEGEGSTFSFTLSIAPDQPEEVKEKEG